MKKLIGLIASLGLILILAGCSKQNTNGAQMDKEINEPPTSKQTQINKNSETIEQNTQTTYSLSDIAAHNIQSDCRTTIDSKVYNITSAFGKHKGGDTVLSMICGIDGTTRFNNKHGTNEKAKGRLQTLQIGILK